MNRFSRAAAGALGLALSLTRAAAAQVTSQDDASFIWSKALPAGSTLAIKSANGPIDVRESPNDRVEVRAVKTVTNRRASLRDVTFDVREVGGETTICTVYEGVSLCDDRRRSIRDIGVRVTFTVLIPRSLRLNLATGNGAIAIDQAGADVIAATGNGRVSIGETTGRVDVSTGNGDVQVESARGPVRVSTGNGRVFVATGSGPVNVTTGNGDITARVRTLPADAAMTMTSGSGSIRVTLPSDFNGQLDASTGNGSLRSEFDISIIGRIDPRHIRGTIGRGGPLLRLQTGNGSVELRKG
jgi:DUF4097 and DUF4098 domain-containing protein YvlB